jgi:hypothetical protein
MLSTIVLRRLPAFSRIAQAFTPIRSVLAQMCCAVRRAVYGC